MHGVDLKSLSYEQLDALERDIAHERERRLGAFDRQRDERQDRERLRSRGRDVRRSAFERDGEGAVVGGLAHRARSRRRPRTRGSPGSRGRRWMT